MKQYPRSQSSATMTAKALDAIASDLALVVEGLHKAARLYRGGDFEGGANMLAGTNCYIAAPLNLLQRIK